MSALSNSYENIILNYLFGKQSFLPPATYYLALSTSVPTAAGGVTEPAAGGYARAPLTNSAAMFPGAASGTTGNAQAISFPPSTGSWGSLAGLALFDAVTGGTMVCFAGFPNPVQVDSGVTVMLAVNGLTFTLQ